MQTQHIALALFLILVTVGIIVILSILIVIKRRITRRKSRVERNTYTPGGYGLSKVWREKLERRLNATVRVRTEPRVFGTHYEENFTQYMADGKITFLFRAKAVDEFLKLKESILSLCPDLEAPPIRGIQPFLLGARDQAMSPPASRDRIEEYCRLYLWARHDLTPFGEAEYEKLCSIQRDLMELVQRAAAARESAASSTPSGQLSRGHSSKLHSSNRTISKLESVLLYPSGDDGTFSGPTVSRDTKLDDLSHLERGKPVSKPNAASLTLRRRRGHELLISTENPPELIAMHDMKTSRAYTKQLDDDLDPVTSVLDPVKSDSGHDATAKRRGSCQSDGSQTALIDLDPLVVISPWELTQPATRNLLAGESFGSTETKPILPTEQSGSPRGGMENEGVNC